MKLAVNCTRIDPLRSLGIWHFGQRLIKAMRNRDNVDVIGLIPSEKIDDFDSANMLGIFDAVLPISSGRLDVEEFDAELSLLHLQVPCTEATKAIIFHDLHLWDVPWKHPEDPAAMMENLRDTVKDADAILTEFPRTHYDLPKVMPEVSDRLFLTISPTMIEYAEQDTDLTARTRVRYDIGEHDKIVLYPASLQPHKNHVNLFRAIKVLERCPIRLVCTGSQTRNQYTAEISQLISELDLQKRVIMTGKIGDRDMKNMYHLADLVVSPSLSEGGAYVAQEAILYGKSVICSDIRPARLHLQQMRASVPLFDPLTPEDIADTISSALSTAQDNSQAKAVIESWTWDRLAEQYWRVLNWLSAGKPSGEMPMFLDDSLGYLRRRGAGDNA